SVVAELANSGVQVADSAEEIPDGAAVIIRSHGAARRVIEDLRNRGCEIIDATCPNVSKVHQIAEQSASDGRTLLILGDPNHPEVQAVTGWAGKWLAESEMPDNTQDLENLPLSVVCQTTLNIERAKKIYKKLKKDCTNAIFYDTICNATSERQEEAQNLAERCEVIIVVGDKSSSNANRLAELCTELNPNTIFVENANELNPDFFTAICSAISVGITAGASTPNRLIEEVYNKMLDANKDTALSGIQPETEVSAPAAIGTDAPAATGAEENFDELLNQNFKTLRTGEKVSGYVMSISPTEVTVDLGAKQSGYIPADELSDEPGVTIEDLIHVGDRVEAYVMRVNDVEGMITLSKRRLDLTKNWDEIEAAVDSKEILEGTVIEENKGGVVAMVKGYRIFIPASQSGLPKDAPMSSLLHQKVNLRITEATKAKRRIVGSIRVVASEQRRVNAQKIWDEIEEGKVYTGIVKTLTNFGAFIDIGGVDGMAHVSSLSWGRVKKPSSILSVGDEVEVYVTGIDREKKKISLGYRKLDENPWLQFTEKFREGDIVDVKIISLTSFGAFAQIIPNVDGLIHVSQIAPYRVEKPSDVLSEGELVTVKITAIDYERQKISLSIRAANEPSENDEEPAENDDNAEE
ncbi:MAG: bifunctional 4-hydroxy-3-methylbut-2-enyl diphosphate reductase/30S ribosomal protein S1, partial [Oscillospiraceae bacterium]|nr:bifunctional 4-hydroxy-3-methylbut-2-enyl diphosphate reductase/30S ribosomal protein S1 [Oscillospiraceae bacterium]